MAASVRTSSGFVTADARRGSVSAGPREVPFEDLEAVEVAYAGGDADTAATYAVSLVRGGGPPIPLVEEAETFGDARVPAVEFARECGLPIRDATFGKAIERRWEEWAAPLKERQGDAPPPRPPAHSPGDELRFTVEGTWLLFHSRPGSLRRIWKKSREGPKATLGQWILGIIFLPLFLVLFVPLLPVIAVAALVVYLRTGGRGPTLEVSSDGVRQKALDETWIPADEIRDVEVFWKREPPGELAPFELVVRSDGARISYSGSGAGTAEMEWLRDWVTAIVCGG